MANIKNLQMWNTICNDPRISITKSMFGLKTKVIYKKSGSTVKAQTIEYSPADGDRLKQILSSPVEQWPKSISGFHPKGIVNGNYKLEVCKSEDNEFLALQLLQFSRMNYEPVLDIIFLEGEQTKAFAPLL